MLAENVRALIEQGENVRVAFKTCRDRLTRDIYETICSFLNRCGGYILLGVADRGEIVGLEPDANPAEQPAAKIHDLAGVGGRVRCRRRPLLDMIQGRLA